MSFVIAAADHPSLSDDIEQFLVALREETRYFGPKAAANPKPFPSLIEALGKRDLFRLAAVECGRIVGLTRVDERGELYLAVVVDRRGAGVGLELCRAALQRAAEIGMGTVVLRSTQRSKAVKRLCSQFGCVIVDHDRGRSDLIVSLDQARLLRQSA
jgi:GNAT superfamily N-acetyltransferase